MDSATNLPPATPTYTLTHAQMTIFKSRGEFQFMIYRSIVIFSGSFSSSTQLSSRLTTTPWPVCCFCCCWLLRSSSSSTTTTTTTTPSHRQPTNHTAALAVAVAAPGGRGFSVATTTMTTKGVFLSSLPQPNSERNSQSASERSLVARSVGIRERERKLAGATRKMRSSNACLSSKFRAYIFEGILSQKIHRTKIRVS